MIKRAVVLVPGYSRRAQLAARDQLVNALDLYTDGYITTVADGVDTEGYNYKTVTAGNRANDDQIELDVYEAFWGDLVPDWSQESPWARFVRASKLILYWSFGGLSKSLWRKEAPTRTVWAMMIAAFCLLLWYLVVAKLLVVALGDAESGLPVIWTQYLPGLEVSADPSSPGNPTVVEIPQEGTSPEANPVAPTEAPSWLDRAITWAVGLVIAFVNWLHAVPILFFFIGLIGLSTLESIANVASFTRAYLRDDPMGEDDLGLRAKSRYRVLDVLDHVHGKTDETGAPVYTDVHVVAHSLGGVIAVDALAEYGTRLSKTVLHTWGSAFGVLVQQEPLIEMEIGKLYDTSPGLLNWVDVVIRKDIFASDRKRPFVYKDGLRTKDLYATTFGPTINPPMPMTRLFGYDDLHKAYYRSEDAMLMLVKPTDALPPKVVPTLPQGSLSDG